MSNNPEIRLIRGGPDYFNLLNKLILNAENEIHLQTYIFEPDVTGLEVLHNLISAAKKGVKVYVVLDFFGSLNMYFYLKNIPHENFKLKYFGSIHWKYILFAGRRLHHKILCVDGKMSLVGGINIAEKYRGMHSIPPWLDYAIYFEHQHTAQLVNICRAIFQKEFNVVYEDKFGLKAQYQQQLFLQILQNDWFRNKNEIYKAYIDLIRKAKKEIIIINAYFLPGRKVFFALRKAAKNKVKIKILFGSKSDIPLIRNATFFIYKLLYRHKIEIYEWLHGVVHAKTMIIDNQYLMIGSFNLNALSQFGSIETNVLIKDSKTVNEANIEFQNLLSNAVKITNIPNINFFNKILSYLSFIILRLGIKTLIAIPFYGNKKGRWKMSD
jgi:cardiolipin synthase